MINVKGREKAKTLAKGADELKDRLRSQSTPKGSASVAVSVPFFGGSALEMAQWDSVLIIVPDIATCLFEETSIVFGGGGPSEKWDVKPAPGTDGARETDQGYLPAQLSMDILLWNRTLFDTYCQLIAVAKVKPGKTRSLPIEVHHPHTQIYSLCRFAIMGTPLLKDAGGKQRKTASFHLLEYFEQPKKRIVENANKINPAFRSVFDRPDNGGKSASTRNKPRFKDSGP